MATTIGDLISERSEHYAKQIWKGIGDRSSSVSSLFLFILVQLLANQDAPVVQSFIRSEAMNLLGSIRQLCRSKFSHVQVGL
jgi:hypothetical protein